MVLLLIPVFFLVAGLITILEQDAALDRVMENQLVDHIFRLKATVLPRELGEVVWRLRVVGGKHFEVILVAFLRSELFLLVAGHVVLLVANKVVIFLDIVVVVFFDLAATVALFSRASSSGWHFQYK